LPPDLPTLEFPTPEDWEQWLRENHASSPGVLLKIAKKRTGVVTVVYPHVLEIALCYGWIDSQRLPLDETYFLQRYTPRSKRSKWSQVNRDKAIDLIAQGRMRPAGLAEVERAKADGRWQAAYAPQRTATVPADLQAALDGNPKAKAFFTTLSGINRYAILFRVHDAKRPETRARRIEQFVAMLADGKTHHSH
jgi:uncharacterized protein YdeI (YjbR/CyaY-like superfamily)